MAIYYNLGTMYEKYRNDSDLVQDHLVVFCKKMPKVLKKIKIAIEDLDYLKVEVLINKIIPGLELLGMDLALDEARGILEWTGREGKKKEAKEIYKVLKIHVKNAIKELDKDFITRKK